MHIIKFYPDLDRYADRPPVHLRVPDGFDMVGALSRYAEIMPVQPTDEKSIETIMVATGLSRAELRSAAIKVEFGNVLLFLLKLPGVSLIDPAVDFPEYHFDESAPYTKLLGIKAAEKKPS